MEQFLQALTSTVAAARLPSYQLKPFKGDMAYAFSPSSDPNYSTLNDFLLHFRTIYTSAKEDPAQWPYRMLQHLEGSALAAVHTELRRRPNSTFDDISSFMHQRFLLADSPRALRDAIRALKQGSGAISTYIDENSRLMSFVDFPEADYYVDIFVEGLSPSLAKVARTFISNRVSSTATQPSLEQIKRHLLATHVPDLPLRAAPTSQKAVSFLSAETEPMALAATSGYLPQPKPPQAPANYTTTTPAINVIAAGRHRIPQPLRVIHLKCVSTVDVLATILDSARPRCPRVQPNGAVTSSTPAEVTEWKSLHTVA